MSARVRILAWWAGLGATIAVLSVLGGGALAPPPVGDADRLQAWLRSGDAVSEAFAVLRIGLLLAATYLLVVSVLVSLARATRSARLVRLVDLGTLPAARRLLAGVAGISLSLSTAAMASTAPARPGDGSTGDHRTVNRPFVIQRVDDEGDGTATIRVVASAAPAPPAAPVPPTEPREWVTIAGESMWAKAEAVLTEAWGRPPSDAEVVPFWQALIDANRSRLADPANPDLLFAGQSFELPAPPPMP